MKEPKVGILMATYNGEKFLSQQLDSILCQTYTNWKLLIHDDVSSDGTVDLIKNYVRRYPDKINFIDDKIKCGGAKENFAHLINIAKASYNFDYIMFSDQDDVWLNNKIELTLSKMIELEEAYKNLPIIVHTDLLVVDSNLKVISNSFWEFQRINPKNNTLNCLLLENTVTGCTMMINKVLLDKIFYIPSDAIIHDWWIALICSALGGYIFPINKQTILYRQHGRNDTGAKDYSITALFKRFFRNPYKTIERIYSLSKLIRLQNKALIRYLERNIGKNEFLEMFEEVIDDYLKRKIFFLREGCLCGTFIKKIWKFLFF